MMAMDENNPHSGDTHMTESVILSTGLHRVKFQRYGLLPDMSECKERCKVSDRLNVFSMAWMDENRVGHVTLAWKETQPIRKEGTHDSDD